MGEIGSSGLKSRSCPHEFSAVPCIKSRTLGTSFPKQCWCWSVCGTIPCIAGHRVLSKCFFFQADCTLLQMSQCQWRLCQKIVQDVLDAKLLALLGIECNLFKLIPCYEKYLNVGGDYVEEYCKVHGPRCHGVFSFGNKVSVGKKWQNLVLKLSSYKRPNYIHH